MGRKRLKTKPIVDTKKRISTWNKRKHGVLKKAMQLAIMCGVEISLVMINPATKESFHYSSVGHVKKTLEHLETMRSPPSPMDNDDYYVMFKEEKEVDNEPAKEILSGDMCENGKEVQVGNASVENVSNVDCVQPPVYNPVQNMQYPSGGYFGYPMMTAPIYYYPMPYQAMPTQPMFNDGQRATNNLGEQPIQNFQNWSVQPVVQNSQEIIDKGLIATAELVQDKKQPSPDSSRKRKRDENQNLEDDPPAQKKQRTEVDTSKNDDVDLRIQIPSTNPNFFMVPVSPRGSLSFSGTGLTPRSITPRGGFSLSGTGLTPRSPGSDFSMLYFGSSGFTPTTPLLSPMFFQPKETNKEKAD
eukprot:TRINITY_DN7674_c0_g1_i1.p1 TRINITY_DN7674_c0_g1~~TRINITY_DN7674_c0_g1_i1.p1  ORF type:complete len:357 (+),score=80.99 TRINITY_DN7674_c0_g1_i1:28-1098(+)